MRDVLSICVAASAFASPAAAQFTVNASMAYALTWQDTGNNNGVIEVGEGARFRLTVTMSPAVGSMVNYTGGSAPSGTMRGIASGFVDLVGSSNAAGAWTGLTILPAWDSFGAQGTATDGGSRLRDIHFGQNPPNNASINTTNPIVNVFEGVWTPSSYAPRITMWSLQAGTSSGGDPSRVFILPNGTGETPDIVRPLSNLGSAINVLIVPAPSGAVVLALAAAGAGRRRRSR